MQRLDPWIASRHLGMWFPLARLLPLSAWLPGCCQLLDRCGLVFQPQTQEMLLQLLLSAAQDDWQEVAASARAWLQRQAAVAASSGAGAAAAGAGAVASSAFSATSESLLLHLIEGLPAALRSGDAVGRQHAQKLTSAIQARCCHVSLCRCYSLLPTVFFWHHEGYGCLQHD
jgi:hypothetical protein